MMHTLHRLGESIPFEDAIASLLLTVNIFAPIEWFLDHIFGAGMDVLADLLALDEPTVGVDAESREEFYSLINELNATGLTVILIEHDIGVVTTHATDIACVNRQLYFDGNPEEFVETDALSQAYGKDQHVLKHDHK